MLHARSKTIYSARSVEFNKRETFSNPIKSFIFEILGRGELSTDSAGSYVARQTLWMILRSLLRLLWNSKMLKPESVPVVVVLGSTGVGKSQLAIEIAAKYKGEVISADSMQVSVAQWFYHTVSCSHSNGVAQVGWYFRWFPVAGVQEFGCHDKQGDWWRNGWGSPSFARFLGPPRIVHRGRLPESRFADRKCALQGSARILSNAEQQQEYSTV